MKTLQEFIKSMKKKHGKNWSTRNITGNEPIHEDMKTMNGN